MGTYKPNADRAQLRTTSTFQVPNLNPKRYPALHAALLKDTAGTLASELSSLLDDQRRAPRKPVEILGRLDQHDYHVPVRLLDISRTGTRLRLLRSRPLDVAHADRLRLRCHVVHEQEAVGVPLDVHVSLVRVGQTDAEAMELGFRFLQPSVEQISLIDRLQQLQTFC